MTTMIHADITEVLIPAVDGFMLSALLLQPPGNSKGVIQFHPGTVTKKEFYLKFCSYLSEHGYTVILFDYRGMGKSRPSSLKGFDASITDWGSLDMAGVLDWANKEFPDQTKCIVAHSMGGQILGLMHNYKLLEKIVTIASSYGNWRNYSGFSHKYISAFTWLFYMSCAPKIFGYLPLKKINMGEDLPIGVSNQLWNWYINNYSHSKIMDRNNIRHFYYEIRKPFKAYFIEDDNVATKATVSDYEEDFCNSHLDIEIIRPNDLGVNNIGHYGFFKEQFRDSLWKNLVDWLENSALLPDS